MIAERMAVVRCLRRERRILGATGSATACLNRALAEPVTSCRAKKTIRGACRRGLATLDYVIILAFILPLVAFMMRLGPQIIRLAYDMVGVLVSWPFL